MAMHALLLRDNQQTLEVRDAIPRPATFDAEHNTIEAVIATSYPVPRRDQRGEYLEILDIAGLDLEGSRGASMLDAHRQDSANSILGTLDAVRREGSSAIGLLRFSSRPDVQPILEDVRTGITSQCSAGYEVLEFREGTDAQGRRTKTATKWRIREVSLVPVAADPHARTRNRPAPQGSRAAINRQIRELCTRAGVSGDVVDDLIDREATIEDARGLVLDSMIARSSGASLIRSAHNMQTLDNPQAFIRAVGEALH